MRRANHLLPLIEDVDNLRYASWKAAKGKRYNQAVLAYQANVEDNLQTLRQQIQRGKVQVGDYRHFKVYEPKERDITAAAFCEQVLHHALMNVCHPVFERYQIYDSYASRKGKGTYAALDRAKQFTHRYEWFLKLDVRKFFETIHHEVLKAQLARLFKEPRLLGIFGQLINSYEAHPLRGLPIGNLTSQYFANHFLSGLDHFIKEQLHIRGYVRYMDDMVLWADEKQKLKTAQVHIQAHVREQLRSELKPPQLNRSRLGLPFLGYRVFPHHVRLLQKSKQRFIRKLTYLDRCYQEERWTEAACQRRGLPLVAFTNHADSLAFRKKVTSRLKGAMP